MTLGDKIKGVFHKDTSDSTTAPTTGPLTGPDAYHPMRDGASKSSHGAAGTGSTTGQAGTGSQYGSGQNTGAGSNTGYDSGSGTASGNNVGGSNAGQGATGTGSGTGSRALGNEAGAQSGRFGEGYTQDEPGYSEKAYGSGNPVYRENIQQGNDGSYSADLSAQGGTQEWQRARELTEAAEREAAAAQLSGNKAERELSAAEQAEAAVRKAQAKHREALLEAEKYRERIGDPSNKEAGVAEARDLYKQKQSLLAEAERALRDAEAELAGRRRDHEKLHPQVEQYGQKLPGLEDEYTRRQREREQAEGQREKYLLSAEEAQRNREGYAADLEALLAELEKSERRAHEKQQEYIEARNSAQRYAQEVANLKAKLREADGVLAGHRNRANQAEQNLPAYREAEERALRDLEDSKAEWYRLKELEDEYARSYQDANNRLQALQGNTNPASKELRDAKGLLASRQDDLDRARQRAVAAEGKYNELLSLADRHKRYGDSAADAAHRHGEGYEAAKREAHIHGDKHVEYWNEAKTHGESGSTEATSAIKKLEEKVKGLLHKNDA